MKVVDNHQSLSFSPEHQTIHLTPNRCGMGRKMIAPTGTFEEKKQLLISIIIPVYNVAPYLREALDSAVHQTYESLEIIIVDDGSTDGSGSTCDEYCSDSRVTVIHQENQGVSTARNVGLDHATGEYITFLDSDDAYHPSFISDLLETIHRTGCDIVVCKHKEYYTSKKMSADKRSDAFPSCESGKYSRIQALHGLLSGMINLAVWGKLYKRELWNNVRFRSELKTASDHVVSFQVFDKCNSVYVIAKPLYLYRIHPDSISRTFSTQNIDCQISARSIVANYLKSHCPQDFSEMQIWRYEISRLSSMTFYYVRSQDKTASEYLEKQITDMADKIGIGNCGNKTKVKYYMMRLSPRLLKSTFAIYLKIKMSAKMILGR